jgi:hypothetical protein
MLSSSSVRRMVAAVAAIRSRFLDAVGRAGSRALRGKYRAKVDPRPGSLSTLI